MNQPSLLCLSLVPNLRCFGFTLVQFMTLVIPTAVEVFISLSFICLYPGPGRQAQTLLAADAILYFIWALLDMLSHVVPAARNSLSVFQVLDFLVGVVSFTPILVYSIYIYRLSLRDFIPTLPRSLQPYLKFSLPILIVAAVTLNEVSSFVGTHLGTTSGRQVIVEFTRDLESLWLSLNQFSLAIYAVIQFFFFLLSFSRFSWAFLDQRRIKLTHSDERHFLHGIIWINAGIIIGFVETIIGFARVSFGVVLARRILRLIARAILMFGLLKGLDVSENFEDLVHELRGVSRIGKRISLMLGVNPQRASMFRRTSETRLEQSKVDERASTEEQVGNQRVTVHYEKGRAPWLQIRFSALDFFPERAILADMIQQRGSPLSRLVSGRAGVSSAQQHDQIISDDMVAARNAAVETPRARSALVVTGVGWHIPPDWARPPEGTHTRRGSGETISDNLSIIRDLERRFPSLPPRVTGKYRGSILGESYDDELPLVGVSRQSSVRHDGSAQNQSEEGGVSVALSSSGSIKRKPPPPLLDSLAYISGRRKRSASTWAGSTQIVNHFPDPPVIPNSPWESTTIYDSDPALTGKSTTPESRRTAHDLIKRASNAVSEASIHSAKWFFSASSSQLTRTPLTTTEIGIYRRGSLGSGSARPKPNMDQGGLSNKKFIPKGSWRSGEHTEPSQSPVSIGSVPTRITPTPTFIDSGSSRAVSWHGSVHPPGEAESKVPGRHGMMPDEIDQI